MKRSPHSKAAIRKGSKGWAKPRTVPTAKPRGTSVARPVKRSRPSKPAAARQNVTASVRRMLGMPAAVARTISRTVRKAVDYEVTTAESGAGNTADFFKYVYTVATAAAKHLAGAPGRLAQSARLRLRLATKRATAKSNDLYEGLKRGTIDLVRQLTADSKHLTSGVRAAAQPVLSRAAALLAPVSAPLRRLYASQAKQEVLGEVSSTPGHAAHREHLLLVGGAVAITLGALLVIGGTGTYGSLPVPSPSGLLNAFASASPERLTVVMAAGVGLVLASWFWVRMLLDSFRRSYPSNTERTKWRLVVAALFAPGALLYFFKVYNHWTPRRFVAYHFLSIMVTGVAVVVASSTYGTLLYFNQKAEAHVAGAPTYKVPKLDVDEATKAALLIRPKYGAPLTPNIDGGRVDPFAPVPGQNPDTSASPSPSPSASPSPSPLPNR